MPTKCSILSLFQGNQQPVGSFLLIAYAVVAQLIATLIDIIA